MRIFLLRLLRVPCGHFGGEYPKGSRWCLKPFGHSDSHAYDYAAQPLNRERFKAQGYDT